MFHHGIPPSYNVGINRAQGSVTSIVDAMSAVQGGADGPTPAIQVLFTLHPGFDTLDLSGPLEVFGWARHNIKDAGE